MLHRLLPKIRIGVAHGQMNEHELEQVMLDLSLIHISEPTRPY